MTIATTTRMIPAAAIPRVTIETPEDPVSLDVEAGAEVVWEGAVLVTAVLLATVAD
jgi:hypothetical protein